MDHSITTLNRELISTRWREDFESQLPYRYPRGQDYLDRLVDSMKEYGFLLGQRILVYDDPSTIDLYQLVTGLLRFRAATIAGITQIPVIIVHGGLTPLALKQLCFDHGEPIRETHAEIGQFIVVKKLTATVEIGRAEIAKRIGITVDKVYKYQKLSQLPQQMINLWLDQKRGGKRKPFHVTWKVIDELYAAVRRDRGGSTPEYGAKTLDETGREIESNMPINYDPNGGPEYQATFNKLNKH
jgi:hypothetical protein